MRSVGSTRGGPAALVATIAVALAAVVTVASLAARTTAAEPSGRATRSPVSPSTSAAGTPTPAVARIAPDAATSSPAQRPTVPAGSRLLWSDEFSGPAGSSVAGTWRPQTGGAGWGNGEQQCDTADPANSALDGDGHLVITTLREPGHVCADGQRNDYTSARLSTADVATAKYGRIRVRAQVPTTDGLWPGIWALGADESTVGWPKSGEIDIAEVVGTSPDTVYQTLHGPSYGGSDYSLGTEYTIGQPFATGFHTYGVDWTPDRIDFSVDGDVYVSYTRAEVEQHGEWVFDKPFYLLLDVAVGGTFPGPPTSSSVFPQRMLVDYVRVYD